MHVTPEFALSRDDYGRLQKVVMRRLRQRRARSAFPWLAKVAVWLMISTSLFLFFKLVERVPEEAATLEISAAFAVAAVLLMAWWPAITARTIRRQLLADNGSFLRPHRLEVTDDALFIRWSTGSAETRWSGFIGRDEDDTNIYLFVDHCAAYVVPRAAVAGFRVEFDRCLEIVPAN